MIANSVSSSGLANLIFLGNELQKRSTAAQEQARVQTESLWCLIERCKEACQKAEALRASCAPKSSQESKPLSANCVDEIVYGVTSLSPPRESPEA